MKPIHKILVLVLISLLSSGINAQISAPGRFYEELTSYPAGNDDPIFYFEDINSAQLIAPTGATYQWFQYSNTSNSFEPLMGENGNTLNTVGEYGYQVQVDNGAGMVSNYYCWAFVPLVTETSISIVTASCSILNQLASPNYKNLVYYNHKGDNSNIAVDYGFVYDWSSIPLGPIEDKTEQDPSITAPTEDTDYSVSISSKFSPTIGTVTATNEYEAIAVFADFEWEPITNAENEDKEVSTPMDIRFHGDEYDGEILSKGKIDDWYWEFGDVKKGYEAKEFFPVRTAGEHQVFLIVRNLESGCESMSKTEPIIAKEMVVKVPNAFTPFSSPGSNDEFRVMYRSVNKFTMIIYNRWGRTVYKGTNPAEGWDGRINGRKAEPGVYFYMIEAEGFNKDEHTTLEGAVHLIIN